MLAADTLTRVETPALARRPGRLVMLVFGAFVVALPITPWQQTVSGMGTVMAFAPVDREQVIQAPVAGRVVEWRVLEGQQVAEGEPLVAIEDIDPDYVARLEKNLAATEQRVEAAQEEARAYRHEADSLARARKVTLQSAELQLQMAEQEVAGKEQTLEAERANLNAATLNLERQRTLHTEGLTSQRELELAELARAKAQAAVNKAEAALTEAKANTMAKRAEVIQKGAEADAKIASVEAKWRKAQATEAKALEAKNGLETDLARQSSRLVRAPRAGIVLRIAGSQGGAVVKMGDQLAVLVPATTSRAVELWVDGNDAPLVAPGRKVRLQFEGWPAVQFVGWPSVAVGTFGGQVSVVDPLGRREGKFRVLVEHDPADEAWPHPQFLRQGVKAKAWVLLEQVPLGYELWRRLNGFPVALSEESTGALMGSPAREGAK